MHRVLPKYSKMNKDIEIYMQKPFNHGALLANGIVGDETNMKAVCDRRKLCQNLVGMNRASQRTDHQYRYRHFDQRSERS